MLFATEDQIKAFHLKLAEAINDRRYAHYTNEEKQHLFDEIIKLVHKVDAVRFDVY